MLIHVIEPLLISDEKMAEMSNLFIKKGHEIKFFSDRNEVPKEIINRSKDAQVVVIGNLPFPKECIIALSALKMLAIAFTGVDHVDVEACKDQGVLVSNASGYSTINVAELTIGLMIDLLRNVTRLDPITRAGGTKTGLIGNDLAGKTVGLIGLGAIGLQVARILKAFGCNVLGFNKERKPLEKELDIQYVGFEALLVSSDIISLHCPLNDQTRSLIGQKELSLMKKEAFIINCARGPIIDMNALYKALLQGQIAGAGLDVFEGEPPLSPELPLLKLHNVVVTPHIAFATEEAFLRRADIVSDNILKWIGGNPQNVI